MSWAAIFPGQGSQHVGMGKFLVENFKSARHLFEEASDTLKINFQKLCFEGPESDLTLTENTQPALLLVSTATFQVLSEVRPFEFVGAAGHSIGEYAAVVTASSMKLTDGLKAVRSRGRFMQEAVPVGAGGMLAVIGMSDAQVRQLCLWVKKESGHPLEPANFNAPGQVVISGSLEAIEWTKANFKAEAFAPDLKKVRLIPLNVSAPFHSSLMKPAEERMRAVLNDIPLTSPQWPIVQNYTAEPVQEASLLRENLISQVAGPVRWVECVAGLKALGATRLIEFGSGKVLHGLVKKIDSGELTTFNITSLDELRALEHWQQ